MIETRYSPVYKKSDKFLYLSVFSMSLIVFVTGAAHTWTSPVLSKLRGEEGPSNNPLDRPITILEESWITSLLFLGGMVGPFLAALVINKIGRKGTVLLAGLPIVASYFIAAFGTKIEHFYIARFMLGLGYGPSVFIPYMYVGEIAKPSNRGFCGFTISVIYRLGCLSSYIVGPYTSIRNFCLISNIPMLIFYIAFGFYIPDTPHFFALKKDPSKAKKSLKKLRGGGDVDDELEEILQHVEKCTASKKPLRNYFKSKIFVRGLLISSGLMFIHEFTGFAVVLSYTQQIFQMSHTNIPPEISSIIVGTIYTLSCFLTTVVSERLRKKTLMLTSLLGSIVSYILFCLYFFLLHYKIDVSSIFWFPLLSLVLLSSFMSLGVGPMPWIYLGELFSPEVKAFTASFAAFLYTLLAFIILEVYPILENIIGIHYCFLFFLIIAILGTAFVVFKMPETKDKSLQQIQNELDNGKWF